MKKKKEISGSDIRKTGYLKQTNKQNSIPAYAIHKN